MAVRLPKPDKKKSTPTLPSGKEILEKHNLSGQILKGRAPGTRNVGPEPFWDLHRDGITQGLLARFTTCPEKHRLAMVLGLSGSRTTGALAFGSVVHNVLDRFYTLSITHRKKKPDATIWIPNWLTATLAELKAKDLAKLHQFPSTSPTAQQDIEENYALVEIVMAEYFKRWQSDLASFKWLALEKTFNVPYSPRERLGIDIDDIPVRGKRDGDFEIESDLMLFETKTKGRIEEESIVDTLSYDLQVNLYMWTQFMEYGRMPKGVVYNIIRRPQLKQSVKETLREFNERVRRDIITRPDFYFIRYNAVILPDEHERWLKEFDQMMWKLIMWTQGFGHYRDKFACTGRAGTCEFVKACGQNDFHLYTQREHVFPELQEEAE